MLTNQNIPIKIYIQYLIGFTKLNISKNKNIYFIIYA